MNNKLNVKNNKIIGVIRFTIFGLAFMLIIILASLELNSLRFVEVFFILLNIFCLIVSIVSLKKLAYKLNVQDDCLEAYHEGLFWTLKPIFKINKDEMNSLSVRKNNAMGDDILIHLKDGDIVNFKSYGLEFVNEAEWIKPDFNEYMWNHSKAQQPYVIAYNISRLYNIPFESEYIN